MINIVLIVIYLIIAIGLYIFVEKRLKFLNEKHIMCTWIKWLKNHYKFLHFLIPLLFLICIFISIFVILTFL